MSEIDFERQLPAFANGMEYPPTPNIAAAVMIRIRPTTRSGFEPKRVALSLTILFVLVSSLLLIPPARAAIIEFFQIGIVRIFPQPVEPAVNAVNTPAPVTPEREAPSTATQSATVPLLIPLLDQIAGETNLPNAQQAAPYPILLPSYPADLRQPDHVYIQDVEGTMTILVWVDTQQPEHVTMSLHFIPTGSWAINKMGPVVIEETEVNGRRAIWAVGPYPLWMRSGDIQFERLIDGHVLIWADGKVTYRFETDLSLEEAVRTAESLEPIP